MNKKTVSFLLFFICISSFFLIIFINRSINYWGDEIFSLTTANKNSLDIVKIHLYDRHPPLHSLLLHYWIIIFGKSIFSLRFFSSIFILLSIPLLFFFTKLFTSTKKSLISAFLFSISPLILLWGRMNRYYSFTLFLSLISNYFYFLILTKKTLNFKRLFYYLLSLILLLLSHYSYFLTIASTQLLLYFFINKKKILNTLKNNKQILTIFLFFCTLTIVLLFGFLFITKNSFIVGRFSLISSIRVLLGFIFFIEQSLVGLGVSLWNPFALLGFFAFIISFITPIKYLIKKKFNINNPLTWLFFYLVISFFSNLILFSVLKYLGSYVFPAKILYLFPILLVFVISKQKTRKLTFFIFLILILCNFIGHATYFKLGSEKNTGVFDWRTIVPNKNIKIFIEKYEQTYKIKNSVIIFDKGYIIPFLYYGPLNESVLDINISLMEKTGTFLSEYYMYGKKQKIYQNIDEYISTKNLSKYVWLIFSDRTRDQKLVSTNLEERNYTLNFCKGYLEDSNYNLFFLEKLYNKKLKSHSLYSCLYLKENI